MGADDSTNPQENDMAKLSSKQIRNAGDRAAKAAWNLASSNQIEMFAATPAQMSSERGGAANAASMAAQALAYLQSGQYEEFLTALSLAGDSVKAATDVYYRRKVGITRAA